MASTNRGYLHCAILKASYNFMVKRAHETRNNQFLFKMFKMRFLRFSKCLKTTRNSPR